MRHNSETRINFETKYNCTISRHMYKRVRIRLNKVFMSSRKRFER